MQIHHKYKILNNNYCKNNIVITDAISDITKG